LHSSGGVRIGRLCHGTAAVEAPRNFHFNKYELSVLRSEDSERQYIRNFMCHSYSGTMQKGAECVTKITKIIAGGTILYGSNGKVSNGEVMGRVQVPNLRRSER
jgi:hypothetical protein